MTPARLYKVDPRQDAYLAYDEIGKGNRRLLLICAKLAKGMLGLFSGAMGVWLGSSAL
jgi:hypothetical protein